MHYNKKGQKSPIKGRNYNFFLTNFSKSRAFGMLNLPKWCVVLKVLAENLLIHFSKRALCADNTCIKWLKKALVQVNKNLSCVGFSLMSPVPSRGYISN